MKPLRKFALVLTLALLLAAAGFPAPGWAAPPAANKHQTPPPILIFDDDFRPGDWTSAADLATGGATFTVTQQLTGGYSSPPFRFISHRIPSISSGLATIQVTHIYLDQSYDPALQGAITALDYSEGGIILSFPFPEAFSTTQPVVVQAGRTYRSPKFIRFIAASGQHAWETKTLVPLTAADFIAVDGSENDHPDFSAGGAPLLFGFTRSNSRGATQPAVPAGQDLVIDQGVDNWRITIHRAAPNQVNHAPQAVDDVFILDGYRRSLPLFEIFDVVRNDSDPDQDHLAIVEVAAPTFGSAGNLSDHTVVYQLAEAQASDVFSYTISDDFLTSHAQVQIWIDCACTVLCLNSLELPETPARAATEAIDLPLIYRVRDDVLNATPHGRRYTAMYYTRNPEILTLLMTHAPLRNEALATVELWQVALSSLTDGDGSAIITQAQVDALATFLNHLSQVASPDLQATIAAELARLGPLDDYVGLTMREAKRRAIGDPTLYLPVILQPPVAVSARASLHLAIPYSQY